MKELSLRNIAPASESRKRIFDIVFVHGIMGSAPDTWTHAMGDQKIYWPQWVAEDAPYANVWELNYETLKAKFSENHLLISELARILPLTFSAKGLGQRPIVWVAHSQGGFVLKHLVRQHLLDKSNESLANLVNMTIGVEFFATTNKCS